MEREWRESNPEFWSQLQHTHVWSCGLTPVLPSAKRMERL